MSSVRVVCRFRPQLENELFQGGVNIAVFDGSGKNVTIDGQRKATFTFDRVFNHESTQEEVYDFSAKPIVEDVLKGYNGTIFAYGQTSSGKTFTMEGPDIDGPDRGLIPRIVFNIFQYIEYAPETLEFTVRVSYFEIYMEKIRDLLCDGNDNLQIHENRERGVYVRHATELYMQGPEEVMEVMRAGAERRSVASTNMNDISSRSHSVFLMEITQKDTIKGGVKTGKLYLVDLAGSEKVSKTGADGSVLEEAKNINKSLSALGLVIMTLTDGTNRQHIPYRDSKLTRILQESLGGNARTTIVICASPSSYNEQETFSSLRFGQRAKKITNNAVINVQYSAEELTKQLNVAKKEIQKLAQRLGIAEKELQIWRSGGTVSEEDRVQFSSEDVKEKFGLDDGGSSSSSSAAPAPAESGLSEEEREELLRRETELLDLLDDRDEHVRQLVREIEVLGQDKITITKLAAESANQRAKIMELEARIEEIQLENAEYEMSIEDMAHANGNLDAERELAIREKEALEEDLVIMQDNFTAQTEQIAAMVAALSSPTSNTVTLSDTGTIVDAQFSKARTFISQLEAEITALKKANTDLTTRLADSDAVVTETQRELGSSKLTVTQLEKKLADAYAIRDKLQQDVQAMSAQNDIHQGKIEHLMNQLVQKEESLTQTQERVKGESARGEAEMRRMQEELEKNREAQRNLHAQQLKDLNAELTSLRGLNDELTAQKDKLAVEVDQLRVDLKKASEIAAKQTQELQTITETKEKTAKIERETKVVEEAAKQQLQAFEQLKDKMRSNLLDRCRKAIGGLENLRGSDGQVGGGNPLAGLGLGGGSSQAGSKQASHVQFLEGQIKDLRSKYEDTNKQLQTVQRDNTALEKQCEKRNERIKNLEKMMRETEERMQAEMQRVTETASRSTRSRPDPVRRKSVHGSAQQPEKGQEKPVAVRRGTKAPEGSDGAKGNAFWNEQSSTPASKPAKAASTPAAQPPKPNPLDVEYV